MEERGEDALSLKKAGPEMAARGLNWLHLDSRFDMEVTRCV